MSDLDMARKRPVHTSADVARWAITTTSTVRRWVKGYAFGSEDNPRWSGPVTGGHRERLFSFEDLVEVAAVAALRRAGLSLQRVRTDIEFARRELGIERPLLSEKLLTDGREVFIRDAATRPHLTNLTRSGQVAWSHLETVLLAIDYADDQLAQRWWPVGRDEPVVVDPTINFGRPIVDVIGVRTETLLDRWIAGLTMADIGREYRISAATVEKAVRFENRPALAKV